jgi:PAS domain S-box-containing protein
MIIETKSKAPKSDFDQSTAQLIDELATLRAEVTQLKQQLAASGQLAGSTSMLNETLLQTVLEATADGILILNNAGQVLYSNRQLADREYLPASVFEQSEDKILLENLLPQLNHAAVFSDLVQAEYAQPEQETQSLMEFIDGRVFERYSKPYYGQGKPIGRVISCRDVTQQHQAIAALKQSEQRLSLHVQQTLMAVIECDPDFYIIEWNAAAERIFGFSRAEAIGQNAIALIVPAPLQPQIRQSLLAAGELKTSAISINENCTKSGQVVTCEWCSTPLIDPSGQVIGYTSLGQDITARVQAEAALVRNNELLEARVEARTAELQAVNQQLAQKMVERQKIERYKDELIAIVSHELRTPLTSIYGSLNLLSQHRVDLYAERGQKFIKIATENSERLLRLVNDILDLERLESCQLSLVIKPYNLADLMLKATQQMQVIADQAGIILATTPLVQPIQVDADRILQVLINLLGNAIKFSDLGKTVWLTATPPSVDQPNWLTIQVRDQGLGIIPEQLETIFDRFYQVKTAATRQKTGFGLGLTICRNLVHQHGGEIWAESVVGQGTCFYVKLPV